MHIYIYIYAYISRTKKNILVKIRVPTHDTLFRSHGSIWVVKVPINISQTKMNYNGAIKTSL